MSKRAVDWNISVISSRCEGLPGTLFSRLHTLFNLIVLLLAGVICYAAAVQAQQADGVISHGDLVITGASGTVLPEGALPAGASEIDETFIDLDGASLRVFDVSSPEGPPTAQVLNAPEKYKALAGDIGQVFGLALDDAKSPNIYAGATSVHGLHIVVPDADGDGRPERIKIGQPGATWMDGQFGTPNGGSPGTIWKVEGETGQLNLFADIAGNGGAGLGNLAYDPRSKQLFASDLETGLIHRFDMSGNALGTFDHGLQGRPANGLEAVQDDGTQADITSPSFDAEDPGSWGLTAPERRVWGLGVHKNRLFYGVEDGSQVWSIGIGEDGSFAADPRWELDVPGDPDTLPVSDIAFQANGLMYLAQRGGIASRYDYSRYHTPRKSRVLRYRLEAPNDPNTPSRWVAEPEDYAIGFTGNHRNASGGIAIGYGYRQGSDGSYQFGACEGTLWSSGDALRDNPVHAAKLAQGGPLNVHGVQGNALSLVRPGNVPPFESYYVDFDGQFEDPQASGHVGDVEIARQCGSKRANIMDLRILKRAKPEICASGAECPFTIEIANAGDETYEGPLLVEDIANNGAQLGAVAPAEWTCSEVQPGFGIYSCEHPGVTLAPGESTSLELTLTTPGYWSNPVYDNCAELLVPGAGVDERPYNNKSCDYVATVEPGEPGGPGGPGGPGEPVQPIAPDLELTKYGRYGACDFFGVCEFSVFVTNVGALPYTGTLNVSDVAATPGATMIDWADKAEWNCAASGADSYGCSTTGDVTLTPGDFRELIILVQGPLVAPGFTHVENCASIDWGGAIPDYNPHNEYACAAISSLPPGHPDARASVLIEKDSPATCFRGAPGVPWHCLFYVYVSNTGSAPLEGPIVINDTFSVNPATLVIVNSTPAGVACAPGPGNTGPFTCTHPGIPGGLLPGSKLRVTLFVWLPAATAAPNVEGNCATIDHDNDGDGADETHEACAVAIVCDAGSANCPKDLSITKYTPSNDCKKGQECHFDIVVRNLADAPFPSPLNVTDIPDPGTGAPNVISPGWACAPAGGGTYSCTRPAALPAGNSSILRLGFNIPAGFVGNSFKNCGTLPAGPGNDLEFNDEDCATAAISQPLPPDLGPWSGTTCYRGQSCQLKGRIDNKGEQTFIGTAGVSGTLSPDLQITGISAKTSGFNCKTIGNARYECSGNKLSIEGGAAAEYEITVNVPEDYPHDQVNHIKNMLWPDSKVRDRNSNNDQHMSVIKIVDPPQTAETKPIEPPPPPPPPAGKPDLAISKTASKALCNTNTPCVFTITTSNIGNAPYSGSLTIRDTITPSSTRFVGRNNNGWNCTGNRGGVTCTKPNVTLAPGASDGVILHFAVPRYGSGTANNCATVQPGIQSVPRSGNLVRDVQSALAAQGYYKGGIDGQAGPQTAAAIREYQRLYNMPQTGRIDSVLADRLLGAASTSPGGGDSNPNNNRACASVNIQGEAPPPPPPQCTGGQVLGRGGQCVCPSSKPIWTGTQCIARPPQQCTGGRVRDRSGNCVCPANKPVWTGRQCIAQPPQQCTGGRIRNNQGQCVCPPSLPRWNGQYCSGIPGPQPCSGGRVKDRYGKCVCPSNRPIWSGSQCIPSHTVCSGGRKYNERTRKCECPVSLPHWNGKTCGGIQGPQCSGGRIKDRSGKCVCPSGRKWNGKQCVTQGGECPPGYTRGRGGCQPAHGTPSPTPNCSGGRYYDQKSKSCKCPSNKPLFAGGQCRSLPGGIKLPPGIKLPGVR